MLLRLIRRKQYVMSKVILELIGIKKRFVQTGLDSIEVFSDVNLTLLKGEMVGLFSPSGAGKTTLLQIAGLLDSPTSGKIIGATVLSFPSMSSPSFSSAPNENKTLMQLRLPYLSTETRRPRIIFRSE